ncbi:MAG: Crp/Fnr family transcriptional regulator [Fusobacteriaceae bacterium]
MNLKEFPIFNEVSEDCLKEIMEISAILEFSKKQIIFLEHRNINQIYFLLHGNVVLYRENLNGKRKIIYMIGAGNFINEVVIDGTKSSISCDSFDHCKLLVIPVEQIKILIFKYPEFGTIFLNSMSKKIRRLYRQIKNSSIISIEKKIAAKLWKLSQDYGKSIGEWTNFSIKINNTLLAEMLGTNRETVSRGMRKLINEGIVSYGLIYNSKELIVKSDALKKFYKK